MAKHPTLHALRHGRVSDGVYSEMLTQRIFWPVVPGQRLGWERRSEAVADWCGVNRSL